MFLVSGGVPVIAVTESTVPDLSVGLTVFDVTGSSPVLFQGPTLMTNVADFGSYGKFTPFSGKQYLAQMAVYTDNTLTTLDPVYGQDFKSYSAMNLQQSVQQAIGYIDCQAGQTPSPTFKIFLGDSQTMYLKVVDAESGDPLDLSQCTEILVALPNAEGTFTDLLLSLGQVSITIPASLGKFSVPISSVNSALLNVGQLQDLDVTFTIASQVFTVRFYQGLSVFEV